MQEIWQKTTENLGKVLSERDFSTWIKPVNYNHSESDTVYLSVPTSFFKEWLEDHYLSVLSSALSMAAGKNMSIEFIINESEAGSIHLLPEEIITKGLPEHVEAKNSLQDISFTPLNHKYTFDLFVSGTGNQFAHAASQAVANKPASNYNPLFIYGGVGLGKTHLLCAIGNQILGKNSKARVCYYTSEKFMNEMINCIRYKKMDEFRNKFRKMDVLLIDDIQFMAGKEATQEEFFHTFNSLYESHKQIVVTSDKFPKDIPQLEERLRSRFEWGLIADIQPPDTETKVAILKRKAELNAISLPDDVAMFLGSSSTSNVRELEGMLIRLGAFASLTGNEVTLTMAREVLKDIIVDKSRDVTVEMIQKYVADQFRIKLSDMKSDKRLKALVVPRQIAVYLCRELTKASYPEIGDKFGGKDHSTIIYSMKKVERQLAQDLELKSTIENHQAEQDHLQNKFPRHQHKQGCCLR